MDLRGSLYIGVCEVYRHRILSGTYDMTAIFQHFFLTKKPFRTPTRSYNWRANGAEDQTSALLFDCFPYLFGITERQCLPIREQPSRVKYYTLHRSYCLTVWKVKSFLFLTVLEPAVIISLDTTGFWIKPFTNPDRVKIDSENFHEFVWCPWLSALLCLSCIFKAYDLDRAWRNPERNLWNRLAFLELVF